MLPAMPPRLTDRDLLARLVAFDTTSSNSNLPLLDFLADYLERPGVRFHRDAPADQPKANLVVEIGPPTDPSTRAGLVLCGHMDVVPAGDGGRGRRSSCTSAATPLRARQRRHEGFSPSPPTSPPRGRRHLRQPLVLVLTYDEEVGRWERRTCTATGRRITHCHARR